MVLIVNSSQEPRDKFFEGFHLKPHQIHVVLPIIGWAVRSWQDLHPNLTL